MGNVPSSVMYAIVTTIIVCIVFALFLYSAKQQPELQEAGLAKQEQMNQVNDTSDYLQYAGSTMKGDAVKAVIKGARKSDLILKIHTGSSIVVFNCAANKYGYRLSDDDKSKDVLLPPFSNTNFNEAYQKIGDPRDKNWYMSPTAKYSCEVIQDTSGVVTELDFAKQGG